MKNAERKTKSYRRKMERERFKFGEMKKMKSVSLIRMHKKEEECRTKAIYREKKK